MNTCSSCGIDFRHEDRKQVELFLCPGCAPYGAISYAVNVRSNRIRACELAVIEAAEKLIDGPQEAWGPPGEDATTVEFPAGNVSALGVALANLKAAKGEK